MITNHYSFTNKQGSMSHPCHILVHILKFSLWSFSFLVNLCRTKWDQTQVKTDGRFQNAVVVVVGVNRPQGYMDLGEHPTYLQQYRKCKIQSASVHFNFISKWKFDGQVNVHNNYCRGGGGEGNGRVKMVIANFNIGVRNGSQINLVS